MTKFISDAKKNTNKGRRALDEIFEEIWMDTAPKNIFVFFAKNFGIFKKIFCVQPGLKWRWHI
jgi:hypothetical protein